MIKSRAWINCSPLPHPKQYKKVSQLSRLLCLIKYTVYSRACLRYPAWDASRYAEGALGFPAAEWGLQVGAFPEAPERSSILKCLLSISMASEVLQSLDRIGFSFLLLQVTACHRGSDTGQKMQLLAANHSCPSSGTKGKMKSYHKSMKHKRLRSNGKSLNGWWLCSLKEKKN